MSTSQQFMLAASQLAEYMQKAGATWTGRNEAGSNVYQSANGTFVVAAHGDGRYVTVRFIKGKCQC